MPKVETFLSPEQIVQIENIRGEQSRSNWIKDAVELKMKVDSRKYEYDVHGIIEQLCGYEYAYIPPKKLLEILNLVPGVVSEQQPNLVKK